MTRQLANKLIAGDTYKQNIYASEYDNTDGWEVVLKLVGPTGSPIPYSFTTTVVDATTYELRLGPEVTAAFGKGNYSYALVAMKDLLPSGTDEHTIESGVLEVELRADLNFDTDLRTHARKVLDAINAVIEGRATKDQESYTIAGRTLTRTPLRELLALQKTYEEKVMREEQGKLRNKLYVRFK
jgi:hypothetical protein